MLGTGRKEMETGGKLKSASYKCPIELKIPLPLCGLKCKRFRTIKQTVISLYSKDDDLRFFLEYLSCNKNIKNCAFGYI